MKKEEKKKLINDLSEFSQRRFKIFHETSIMLLLNKGKLFLMIYLII